MTRPPISTDRRLPNAAFAGDSGEPDPEVTAALASYDLDATRYAQALVALQRSRLLVPVVALLGEVEYDEQGLARDKTSEMAAVLMQGKDGRLALLAFTCSEALTAWNPDVRPVPVPVQLAAQSALQDEASAVVVDIAGPVTFVIDGDDLLGLAQGWTLAQLGDRLAWIRPGEQ